MAVAFIGSRVTPLDRAIEHAVALLDGSRSPVITINADLTSARAAIDLARRCGAVFDCADAAAAAEALMIAEKGAMTCSPGEARRRADLLVLVGTVPPAHRPWISDMVSATPDLAAGKKRTLFTIGGAKDFSFLTEAAVPLAMAKGGMLATIAALRASCSGKATASAVRNFDAFVAVLNTAKFPVFVFSGAGLDPLSMEMLQGLVADLNKSTRASSLFLPASELRWGAMMACTWSTGYPFGISFSRSSAEFDPFRYNARRMLDEGECDLHLLVAQQAPDPSKAAKSIRRIALVCSEKPVAGAEVTVQIGEPGLDQDAVQYSVRTGSFVALTAQRASGLPLASDVLAAISAGLAEKAPAC